MSLWIWVDFGDFFIEKCKKKVRQTYVDAKFYGESIFDGFRTIRKRLDIEKLKKHQFSALPSKLDNFESPSTADPTVVLYNGFTKMRV